ncbi:hypothetical protein GQ457_10G006180 [Hibiscus cannabinus]
MGIEGALVFGVEDEGGFEEVYFKPEGFADGDDGVAFENGIENTSMRGSIKTHIATSTLNSILPSVGGSNPNCNGDVRALFAGPVELLGAEYAELMAIRLALSIFIEANWVGKTFLIVESDSQVVINWIANMSSRPWRWWNIFEELDAYS